jgi:heterotetrameric sarcosine oxidase gamma subunit
VIAVQGPRSEEVLAPYVQPIDLAAMPHMSVWQGRIGEVPIRLFRVSFTGEAGFEINLPPDHAQPLWNTLLTRDVTPYGTDAMHILRAEKGYIVIGQETDGTVTPDDVGLGWTIRGADFVGRRSLSLPDLKRADRRQLVGLLPTDAAVLPDEGAQVTNLRSTQSIGHVTSAYRSPTLGRTFALALIAAGRSLIGAKLNVPMPNRVIEVVVTDPVFLDKSGDRRRARPQRSAAIQSLDRHGPASEAPRTTPAAPHVMTGLEPLTHDLNQQSGSSFPVQHRPAADPPSMKLSSRGAKRRGDLVAGKLRSDSLPRPIFFVGPPEHQPAPIVRECNSVRLAMLAPTTRLSIRAGPAAATALGLSLGVLLPTVACRSVTARDRAALWLGPDEWLIIAPQEASDLAIQTAVDHPASIVDVSYRSQTIEISGPRASWCLNAFCPLDLDIRAFPVGMCARTLLGKAEIMLWRIAPQVFHIDVARSLASYVWECLEDASLEFIDPDIALNQ